MNEAKAFENVTFLNRSYITFLLLMTELKKRIPKNQLWQTIMLLSSCWYNKRLYIILQANKQKQAKYSRHSPHYPEHKQTTRNTKKVIQKNHYSTNPFRQYKCYCCYYYAELPYCNKLYCFLTTYSLAVLNWRHVDATFSNGQSTSVLRKSDAHKRLHILHNKAEKLHKTNQLKAT